MIAEEFAIEYGATRPLKFREYEIDSEIRDDFFDVITDFVEDRVNIKTAVAMDNAHLCRLIEKMSILICKDYSPTVNYGITKPEIRWAILYAIRSAASNETIEGK